MPMLSRKICDKFTEVKFCVEYRYGLMAKSSVSRLNILGLLKDIETQNLDKAKVLGGLASHGDPVNKSKKYLYLTPTSGAYLENFLNL